MRLIIRWRNPGRRTPEDARKKRYERLLRQASGCGYYLRQGIELPEKLPSRHGQRWEHHLATVPSVPMREFLSGPGEFYNWNRTPRRPRSLEIPLADIGRTALLMNGFEETPQLRRFGGHAIEEMESYQPESIAGPVAKLRALAACLAEKKIRLDSLKTAVIAFTSLKQGCLREEDRELLWRSFQVPVFEQFRGLTQELLAWECEAHDGLHVAESNAFFEQLPDGRLALTSLTCEDYTVLRLETDLAGELIDGLCPCGEQARRIVGIRPVTTHPGVRAAAAT